MEKKAVKTSGYDVVIVGSGCSGSFVAWKLTNSGLNCLLLEAGSYFHAETYPRKEIDSNSRLYWGGGIELNTEATIGILRPKVLGGGSIVNQALLDRFDDLALDSWINESGIDFFNQKDLAPYYDQVEAHIASQEIPAEFRNRNAEIFAEGFQNNGFDCAPLVRAQKNCKYEDGNDCIECLGGCRIDSKQSMPVTILEESLEKGLEIVADFEALELKIEKDICRITGQFTNGDLGEFSGKKVVLAAGSVGNVRLLLNSGFKNPQIGQKFYTHPQHMVLALYDEKVNSHKGAFQGFKSNDPNFRKSGFKLENVFAPPVAIAMLLPGFGKKHQEIMRNMSHLACIEVAIRDTNPGKITVNKNGRAIIKKFLNKEDHRRWNKGLDAINNIFNSTGAREIIPGNIPIGLHLMGGCAIGLNSITSVVSPNFKMYENENVYISDSSLFPNAPGINPSFTIMALSLKATESIEKDF
jgi:choline dehydrogenase-like flavoprotein